MAIGPRLDLRQSQSLVMTPQLQQAIKLLALSNLELETFVGEELEKNPLLEMGAEDGGDTPTAPETPTDTTSAETDGIDRLIEAGAAGATDAPLDADYAADTFIDDGPGDAVTAERSGPSMGDGMPGSDGSNGDPIDFDAFAGPSIGLHEHLMAQAGATFSGSDLLIAGQIIGQIDDAGYLEASLRDIAAQLGLDIPAVEAVLAGVQSFDPTGVGARSLSECLALQAREIDRYDPAMAKLLDNLELLARGAVPQLRKLCGVDEEDMADMIRELRGYDPKPGLRFASDTVQAVVPDVFVHAQGKGWIVEINSATLPRLLVNRRYYRELSGGPQDKTSKAWLADRLASANWLLKALDQRQRTILRVAEEIVRHQDGFFRHGVAHLKPLTLKQVGEAIEMHESTISRVTSNKYLSCSRGVFELKYFFRSGISANDGGEAVSAEAVKSHIRDLIGAELPSAILSDDALVDMLRAKGFDIARRTVAKYREAIGLGSSVQRRRQKAIAGGR
ncbi:RNA polymerase factor sigma-54 [Sphingobium sufflavum]|uniref:RNA polymerase factor sigma-54 n=1 Tax=Sphingobium sufflavum TaxID=1129547 RepID=UPI001F22E434|nr:RNA polymerase factor sigma-54 [Sphingobium sufflavum]MCE7795953.1 RNA polymerase factor sigma-54 [Sphingobium sufflavum]